MEGFEQLTVFQGTVSSDQVNRDQYCNLHFF